MQPEKSKIKPYFDTLQADLEDHRDPRGKIHNLAFVLCGIVIAILHGRKSPSSIQRFIFNRHLELVEWTDFQADSPISITQLGRVVRGLDWTTYNHINAQYFGVKVTENNDSEWIAVDGKAVSLAIAWAGGHSGVTSPIIGARNIEQLTPALAAVDIEMTTELRTAIGEFSFAPSIATDRSDELK
ncbi:MAG: transposase family protein [Saprospiraceae bacterium]